MGISIIRYNSRGDLVRDTWEQGTSIEWRDHHGVTMLHILDIEGRTLGGVDKDDFNSMQEVQA